MKKKILISFFSFAGLCVAVCILIIAVNIYIVNTTNTQIYSHKEISQIPKSDYDCVIVLGAGVRADNSVSDILRDRLDTSIMVYNSGLISKILMSGDHGRENYDEVNVMKKYAIDAGIDSSNVFMDHAGFSTYETIYRARDIFDVDKALIVTQKYHLHRALYIAKSLGLEAIGVSADLHNYRYQTQRDIREYAARVKEFFNLLIKPEPTYLGEIIPVSGDGDATNDKIIE